MGMFLLYTTWIVITTGLIYFWYVRGAFHFPFHPHTSSHTASTAQVVMSGQLQTVIYMYVILMLGYVTREVLFVSRVNRELEKTRINGRVGIGIGHGAEIGNCSCKLSRYHTK